MRYDPTFDQLPLQNKSILIDVDIHGKFLEEGLIQAIIRDIAEQIEGKKKLKNQLDVLRRWHDITLGREERIIELK